MLRLTDFAGRLRRLVLQAFSDARATVDPIALQMLMSGGHQGVVVSMDRAVLAMQQTLNAKLPDLLLDIVAAGGKVAANTLPAQLLRANAGKTPAAPVKPVVNYRFDATDPRAIEWAKTHAAELVTQVSETTRQDIRDAITSTFEDGVPIPEATQEILAAVGDETRARLIARTEVMTAANEGQRQAWDQAVDAGLLTGREQQVWIVTPDDKLCPICEPLDGKTAPLGGEFETSEGNIDGPPAHPNCRCTTGIA